MRGVGGTAPARCQRPLHATCRDSRAPPRASGRPRAAPPSRYAPPPAEGAPAATTPPPSPTHSTPEAPLLWRRARGGAGTSPGHRGRSPAEALPPGRGAGSPAPSHGWRRPRPLPGDGPRERDGSGRWQLLGAGPHPDLSRPESPDAEPRGFSVPLTFPSPAPPLPRVR